MEKKKFSKLCTAFCLTLGLTLAPASSFQVQAAEVIATVEGTVMSGTTSELLKLSTKEGDMEIKLDSGTDASGCKVLLPDKKIFVSVSHGNDGYLHAVKITATSSTNTVTLDSSTSTVTGKITDKSKDDILYVDTAQGEMEIKLDPTTNLSGCSVLVENKTYQIACTRGSDAYMHAVSISDGTNSSSSQASASSWLTPAPASAVNASTSTVTGTVSDDTKENLLYLDTDGGQMQIVIDSNTDSRGGHGSYPRPQVDRDSLSRLRCLYACGHHYRIQGQHRFCQRGHLFHLHGNGDCRKQIHRKHTIPGYPSGTDGVKA